MNKRLILILSVLLLTIAADQATKHWARQALRGQPPVTVIPGYLELEYHENPGAAFGLLRNVPHSRYILLGTGVLALVLVWTMMRKVGQQKLVANVAFALIAGGALGNMIDRFLIGRVVDFTVMHWQTKFYWPAYNVADVALVVGVGLLILILGRNPEPASSSSSSKSKGSSSKSSSSKKKRGR